MFGSWGLAVAAIVLAIMQVRRMRAVLRPLSQLTVSDEDTARLLPSLINLLEENSARINRLDRRLDEQIQISREFLRHIGFTRYDAFEDIGGMQSFSLCMLNAARTGVLITYLTGKNSARSYAVAIQDGAASRKLSEEEKTALQEALSQEPAPQPQL